MIIQSAEFIISNTDVRKLPQRTSQNTPLLAGRMWGNPR